MPSSLNLQSALWPLHQYLRSELWVTAVR